jgi:hypothetical protein
MSLHPDATATPPAPVASLADRRLASLLSRAITLAEAAYRVRNIEPFRELKPATVKMYLWKIYRTHQIRLARRRVKQL